MIASMSRPDSPSTPATDQAARPFLKWAGGKRQLLKYLEKYLPEAWKTYHEPFLGAAALLFHLRPVRAVINDLNQDLILCYEVVRDHLSELQSELEKHQHLHQAAGPAGARDYFYSVRALDRQPGFSGASKVSRAARMMYLNKTCYNGLYRVNRRGQFNVPYGNYKNPRILDVDNLRRVHAFLKQNNIRLKNTQFDRAAKHAREGDLVYFDPPYYPVSPTASFTGYQQGRFGATEQVRLRKTADQLTDRGVKVLLSNSATDFIRELYDDHRYHIFTVRAGRAINSNPGRRGPVEEVIITNYEPASGT